MNIIRSICNKLSAGCWTLGFIEEPLEDILGGKPININYLSHNYNDRWFADPWILEVNDKIIRVLVEEFTYKEHCGYISMLEIDRSNYKLLNSKIILKLSTHLSFPAILRENGNIYIYPENADGEGLGLYEIETNGNCRHIRTLSKEKLADAIITKVFGEWLMFSTHIPTHNGNELSIHKIDIENGSTRYIGKQSFESNIARNAGEWFCFNNKVYRPAQDCNGSYGKAVILQEVSRKENGSFVFTDIRRLTSSLTRYNTGLHTFNQLNGLSVIDVHGYRYPQSVVKICSMIIWMAERLRELL